MANNFTVAGAAFVSKAGNDSDAGITANAPKATVNGGVSAAAAGLLVVGTGAFSESIGAISSNITGITGDGYVKVYGDNTMSWAISGSLPPAFTVKNIRFEGLSSVTAVSGANLRMFENCTFKDISAFRTTNSAGGRFTKCIFIDCTWVGSNLDRYAFDQCIFVNCTIRDVAQMTLCYVNGVSTVRTISTITAANFNNNNLMGTVAVGNTTYQNLAAHKTSFPALNTASFSLPPLFNNAEKLDFSLQYNSPHLNTDTPNIGGTLTGQAFTVLHPAFQVANGAVWENIALVNNDLVIAAGQTQGTVTTAWIRIADYLALIQDLQYNGLIMHNKSTAGGSATNRNVPDTNVYTGSDASGMGNPDRLTIKMMWSIGETQPVVDADADNGGLIPAGQWGTFLINTQPFVDSTGKTNGQQGFNPASVTAINAIWVKWQVTETNNYV